MSIETDEPISVGTFLQIRYVCAIMMPIVVSFGIVGNILSLVVLTRKEMTSVPVLFLKGLCTCNICELIIEVPEYLQHNQSLMSMDNFIVFYRFYSIIRYGLGNIFSVCSNWIITAVTIERFFTIYYIPGRSKWICTPRRAKITICVIFIASFALNILKFFEFSANPDPKTEQSYTITALGRNNYFEIFNYGAHIVLDTFLPITILVIFNLMLLCLLLKHRRHVSARGVKSSVDMMHVTTLVMAMVLLFVLFHGLSVYVVIQIIILGQQHVQQSLIFNALSLLSNLLTTTNTSCNFILYCVIFQKFRKTFNRIFFCKPIETSKSVRTSGSNDAKETVIL